MKAWHDILALTRPEHRRFERSLCDTQATQAALLKEIVSENADSEFGRRYDFTTIRDVDEFRRALPLSRYEDIAPEIARLLGGETRLLTRQAPLLYEQTGGSNGGCKTIPYTAHALRAFQRGIHPWLHDLLSVHPGVSQGRAYFAISPAGREASQTADGTPIGAANDGVYFGNALLAPLAEISLVPPHVAKLHDIHDWRYLTLRYLLDADDLSLISIWSPSFLNQLLAALPAFADRLVKDIANGGVDIPDWAHAFIPRPERAKLVARALKNSLPDTRGLWPRLSLISCWTHAHSARFLPELVRLFPHAHIQGKGLLSTEGMVSVPLSAYAYPVLATRSAFCEFLDAHGNALLAHELETDGEYEVVMTTPGGLYRYRTGDRVRIRAWARSAPMLEFIGRANLISDVCGEKLSDAFVQSCMPAYDGFAMLTPSIQETPRYILFVDESDTNEAEATALAARLDQALHSNPQYAYARRLGQLHAIRARRAREPLKAYLQWSRENGQRLGDTKPMLLRPETDWEYRLA